MREGKGTNRTLNGCPLCARCCARHLTCITTVSVPHVDRWGWEGMNSPILQIENSFKEIKECTQGITISKWWAVNLALSSTVSWKAGLEAGALPYSMASGFGRHLDRTLCESSSARGLAKATVRRGLQTGLK